MLSWDGCLLCHWIGQAVPFCLRCVCPLVVSTVYYYHCSRFPHCIQQQQNFLFIFLSPCQLQLIAPFPYILEKAMVPHFSILAWKIPWMEEPGRLQPMGLWRVRHDWATSPSLFTFVHWRRKWQPTPVFLPGESQRRGSLVGCHLWGHTELDTTEVT